MLPCGLHACGAMRRVRRDRFRCRLQLHLTLPATVDSERARAKFDKRACVLTVRLPILVGVVV